MLDAFFNVLQLIGGIILSIGYIPQIIKLIRTKSSDEFEIKTFLSVLLGVSLMEAYAINLVISGAGVMFLVTNTMSLIIAVIMVVLIKKYQHNIKYPVIFRKEDEGYSTRVPDLKGCYSEGDTLEEAINNTKEAIQLYLNGAEKVPKATEIKNIKHNPRIEVVRHIKI